MIDPIIISHLWSAEAERVLRRQQLQVAVYEAMRRDWLALPRYVRAWRRLKSRVHAMRRRLGEIIAGERFDD